MKTTFCNSSIVDIKYLINHHLQILSKLKFTWNWHIYKGIFYYTFAFMKRLEDLFLFNRSELRRCSPRNIFVQRHYFRILQGIPPRVSNACFIERLVYSRCRRRTHARNPGIWSPVPARLPNRNSRRILMGPIPKHRAHVSRCLAWP